MPTLFFVMYLSALLCFLLASFGNFRVPHVNIGFLGLAFFAVPSLILSAQAAF